MTAHRTTDHMSDNGTQSVSKTQARLYTQIARAIAYIHENRLEQPELDDVATHIGMSPHHLQRTFSEWAGVSPKKFLKAITLEDAKSRLRQSTNVLDTAFDAGLSGPGRLHDLFVSIDAVTPGEFKSRGEGLTFRYGFHPSPFGECLIVVNARGLTGISFVVDNRESVLAEQKAGWECADWVHDDAATAPYAERAFAYDSPKPELKLLLRGSPFRVKVWEALLRIPEGGVMSYGALAAHIGRPGSARAVAGAIANNLIGYVIPCHRVIRDNGMITGYRWDPVRKSAILGLEAVRMQETGLETAAHTP
ncbi:bifunctional helix-turn-helix domain-containing protein/methylated-DNA--[protein]-cysteine S-methyltransferase [Thalassospiraceae bacterium LMO-JJ14]|nr:bifunctional helix-turn-helix domain-containing protein/methylated-DNA--[protein]-cysteine S-methyltransferase [Thalassospiraceae bacterium LMO-JJ14]